MLSRTLLCIFAMGEQRSPHSGADRHCTANEFLTLITKRINTSPAKICAGNLRGERDRRSLTVPRLLPVKDSPPVELIRLGGHGCWRYGGWDCNRRGWGGGFAGERRTQHWRTTSFDPTAVSLGHLVSRQHTAFSDPLLEGFQDLFRSPPSTVLTRQSSTCALIRLSPQ
jgi:hypothetical protein